MKKHFSLVILLAIFCLFGQSLKAQCPDELYNQSSTITFSSGSMAVGTDSVTGVDVNGSCGLRVVNNDTGQPWSRYNIPIDLASNNLLAGDQIQFSFDVVVESGMGRFEFNTDNTPNTALSSSTFSSSGSYSDTITIPSGITTLNIWIYPNYNQSGNGGSVIYHSLNFVKVGATVPVTGVSVSPTTASINVSGTQSLTASVLPSNATNQTVSWSSGDTSIATVDASGVVTGVASGSAVITVTTAEGGFTATSSISVSDGTTPPGQSLWQENGTDIYYNDGNVGIGIAATSSKLHLFNGASGRSPHGFSDLSVEDDDHGMISILTPSNKSAYYGFADTNDDFVGGIQYDHTDDRMQFRVNNRSAGDMVITNNGNVGIGISNPGVELDVNGDIESTGYIMARNPNNEAASVALSWSNDISRIRVGGTGTGASSGLVVQGPGDTDLFRIMGDGNVAVGTSSVPIGYKMAINGKLITEEVRVELSSSWPDYVFTKGYDLPTLKEVQKHIEEKGHLPNIPSAKEVEENGVQLGEMNKLLLEKIEELTLYILIQQKEIEENKALKVEMEELKKSYIEISAKLNQLENK